jgi:predicted HicB family RNase H-like nuclease
MQMKAPNTKGLVKPVQIRLKEKVHQWVKQQSDEQDRSANWVINKILDEAYTRAQQQQTQGETQ